MRSERARGARPAQAISDIAFGNRLNTAAPIRLLAAVWRPRPQHAGRAAYSAAAMPELPVTRYRRPRSWLPFDRLADTFYVVLVLASMTPLLVLIALLLLSPRGWRLAPLMRWTMAAAPSG